MHKRSADIVIVMAENPSAVEQATDHICKQNPYEREYSEIHHAQSSKLFDIHCVAPAKRLWIGFSDHAENPPRVWMKTTRKTVERIPFLEPMLDLLEDAPPEEERGQGRQKQQKRLFVVPEDCVLLKTKTWMVEFLSFLLHNNITLSGNARQRKICSHFIFHALSRSVNRATKKDAQTCPAASFVSYFVDAYQTFDMLGVMYEKGMHKMFVRVFWLGWYSPFFLACKDWPAVFNILDKANLLRHILRHATMDDIAYAQIPRDSSVYLLFRQTIEEQIPNYVVRFRCQPVKTYRGRGGRRSIHRVCYIPWYIVQYMFSRDDVKYPVSFSFLAPQHRVMDCLRHRIQPAFFSLHPCQNKTFEVKVERSFFWKSTATTDDVVDKILCGCFLPLFSEQCAFCAISTRPFLSILEWMEEPREIPFPCHKRGKDKILETDGDSNNSNGENSNTCTEYDCSARWGSFAASTALSADSGEFMSTEAANTLRKSFMSWTRIPDDSKVTSLRCCVYLSRDTFLHSLQNLPERMQQLYVNDSYFFRLQRMALIECLLAKVPNLVFCEPQILVAEYTNVWKFPFADDFAHAVVAMGNEYVSELSQDHFEILLTSMLGALLFLLLHTMMPENVLVSSLKTFSSVSPSTHHLSSWKNIRLSHIYQVKRDSFLANFTFPNIWKNAPVVSSKEGKETTLSSSLPIPTFLPWITWNSPSVQGGSLVSLYPLETNFLDRNESRFLHNRDDELSDSLRGYVSGPSSGSDKDLLSGDEDF